MQHEILKVFAARKLRAGDMIHPADFGDAIVWESGFVRDEGGSSSSQN
jgi:hypothetical protein